MPVKRSRIVRSWSQGETSLLNQVRPGDDPAALWQKRTAPASVAKPVKTPVKISKPSIAKPEQSRRRILTLGSPLRESSEDISEVKSDAKVGGFLEACYFCKKKIGEKNEVFMYSYLCAFCSPECRDKHIALDRGMEKSSGESTEMNVIEKRWELNLKVGYGARIDKDAAS